VSVHCLNSSVHYSQHCHTHSLVHVNVLSNYIYIKKNKRLQQLVWYARTMRSHQPSTLRENTFDWSRACRGASTVCRYQRSLITTIICVLTKALAIWKTCMVWDAELVPLGATVIKVCVGVIIQAEKLKIRKTLHKVCSTQMTLQQI